MIHQGETETGYLNIFLEFASERKKIMTHNLHDSECL